MPRPRKEYLRSNWKLSLPAPITAKVDQLIFNPLTNKPTYGDRSNLVRCLLEQWLETMNPELTDVEGRVKIPLPAADHIRYVVGEKEVSFFDIDRALRQQNGAPS